MNDKVDDQRTQMTVLNQRTQAISTAAILDRLLMHPLETVISIKQTKPTISAYQIAHKLHQEQGMSGFYRGLKWPVALCVPARFAMFGSYLYAKDVFHQIEPDPTRAAIMSGLASGIIESVVTCPADAYRTRRTFKVTPPSQYQGAVLYKGFGVLTLKCSIANAMIMAGSDWLLEQCSEQQRQSAMTPFFTGTIAGGIAQLVSTPLDVLKTNVMRNYTGMSYRDHLTQMSHGNTLPFSSLGLRLARQSIGFGIIIGAISFFGKSNKPEPHASTLTSTSSVGEYSFDPFCCAM